VGGAHATKDKKLCTLRDAPHASASTGGNFGTLLANLLVPAHKGDAHEQHRKGASFRAFALGTMIEA
jgi:hypothetical protein